MAPYSKKIVKLDVVLDRLRVSDAGTQLPDVTVLRLPLAAVDKVFLHVGEGGDPIDLIQGMALHITPPETTGLFVSSTQAFAGESISLLLGYVVGGPSDT